MLLKNSKNPTNPKSNEISITALNNLKSQILQKNILTYNDYEINSLTYKEALQFDKRTFFEYYLSLIRIKHLLIFAFYTKNDYNSRAIKISLFLFSFSLYFTINSLFFNDSTMHKIYEDEGAFNIIYQIPHILYSSIISGIIKMIVTNLSLTEKSIIIFKEDKFNYKQKVLKLIKCLKTKFFFFIVNFTLLLFFWYYISSFCAVYKNTKIHLIKDTLISFAFSLFYPFVLYLLPSIFRIISLKGKNQNKEYLYIFSKIIQLII